MYFMLESIMTILLGLLICFKVPNWITHGPAKARQWIQLGCNILGVLIVISGTLSIIRHIF